MTCCKPFTVTMFLSCRPIVFEVWRHRLGDSIGVLSSFLASENYRPQATARNCLHNDACSRTGIDILPTCDEQTDRPGHSIYSYHDSMPLLGKNKIRIKVIRFVYNTKLSILLCDVFSAYVHCVNFKGLTAMILCSSGCDTLVDRLVPSQRAAQLSCKSCPELTSRRPSQQSLPVSQISPHPHRFFSATRFLILVFSIFTRAAQACPCVCVSVCLCVTRRYCIKTAKRMITQTTRRDSPGTQVF